MSAGMMIGVPCFCGRQHVLTTETETEVDGVVHRGYAPCYVKMDLKLKTPEQQITELRSNLVTMQTQVDALQAEVIRLNRVMGQQPVLLQPKGPQAL